MALSPACGRDLSEETLRRAAEPRRQILHTHVTPGSSAAVQIREGSETLRDRKQGIVDTARSLKVDDAGTALLLAFFMHETRDCAASQRTRPPYRATAHRYSAANLRPDMLVKLEYHKQKYHQLNEDDNLAEAVRLVQQGVKTMGGLPFLKFHRGGKHALGEPPSPGVLQYVREIEETQALLMDRRDLWDSPDRIVAVLEASENG